MEVISLFDGMSCLQIALKELGIKPDKYYASEIDKYAIAQTQLNFPDTIQLGDVTKWREWPVNWSKIDLITFGSPCQGFSFAGKQLAFDDPRSKLFFVAVEILNHIKECNPKVQFLMENVDMKRDYLRIISEYLGVFPVNINSNLVSAQNRSRWYWTNIRTKKVGLFDEVYTDIPQPKDKGILLKDILEDDIDEKYFLSDKMIAGFTNKKGDFGERFKIQDQDNLNDKGACVTQNLYKIQVTADFIKVDQPACVRFGRSDEGKELRKQSMRNGKDHTPFQAKEIIGFDFEKMNTVTCATTKDNLLIVAQRGRQNDSGEYIQELEPNNTGKTNCLTSVQKDNLVMIQRDHGFNKGGEKAIDGKTPPMTKSSWEQNNLVMTKNYVQDNNNGSSSQSNRYYYEEAKSPTLGIGHAMANPQVLLNTSRIRRLTPLECSRLQTIPAWYRWECSDTQQYRMLGNGWTVKVIEWILSFLK